LREHPEWLQLQLRFIVHLFSALSFILFLQRSIRYLSPLRCRPRPWWNFSSSQFHRYRPARLLHYLVGYNIGDPRCRSNRHIHERNFDSRSKRFLVAGQLVLLSPDRCHGDDLQCNSQHICLRQRHFHRHRDHYGSGPFAALVASYALHLPAAIPANIPARSPVECFSHAPCSDTAPAFCRSNSLGRTPTFLDTASDRLRRWWLQSTSASTSSDRHTCRHVHRHRDRHLRRVDAHCHSYTGRSIR